MPGHLNERTLREFQVNQYRFFGNDINGLQNFVEEMMDRLNDLEKKVSELEKKRGPGRPRKLNATND
jgi:hypothetical protein